VVLGAVDEPFVIASVTLPGLNEPSGVVSEGLGGLPEPLAAPVEV
jgi:hypothetical protein